MRKFGATIVCAACSDRTVHGKTATPHTNESRIGEEMVPDPVGHERVQVHRRRRDAEPEVAGDRAPVVNEEEEDHPASGMARS